MGHTTPATGRPIIAVSATMAIRCRQLTCRVYRGSEFRSSQSDSPEPKRVQDDGHRAERHRGTRDHRAQQQSEEWIEHTRGHRYAEHVVDEGEEQILSDIAHREAAQ